jgi:stage III sporulation protein SpoIIIAA
LFFIAEIVGSTVEDLAQRITLRELWGWTAYRRWKAEQERKAMEEARRKG